MRYYYLHDYQRGTTLSRLARRVLRTKWFYDYYYFIIVNQYAIFIYFILNIKTCVKTNTKYERDSIEAKLIALFLFHFTQLKLII